MFRCGEHAYQTSEGDLEQTAGLLRRKIWSVRMLAADQLEFGHELDQQPSLGAKRFGQRPAPIFQLEAALAQQAADQPLDSLRNRHIRNIALQLVELARGK